MFRFCSHLLVGFVVAATCSRPAVAADGVQKAKELLARYEAFVDGMRVIGYDSLETRYEKGGPFTDWTWTGSFRSSYARGGALEAQGAPRGF